MASDLATTPRSGLTVQCCGDAHLSNFGVFASPERRLVFDINDFDETLPGPWEWDVKRLAVSMLIAARDSGFRAKERERSFWTRSASTARDARFAAMKNLEVWYAHLDIESTMRELGAAVQAEGAKHTQKQLAKARTKDSMSAFSKLTGVVDGEAPDHRRPAADRAGRRTRDGTRHDELFDALHELLRAYRADAAGRSTRAAGGVPAGRLRAQGRRRWQRRYALPGSH